jgi:HSP20 family molecular chaperone IbpA
MEDREGSLEKREAHSPAGTERTRERRAFMPAADIYEREDALVLLADMPGADEKSVNIDLENGTLTITGRVADDAIEGYRKVLSEYESGDYHRRFHLSDEVNTEAIEAFVKDGVLKLVLPKSEKAKPRKIDVKAG